jgi:hypothetical protein
MRGGVDIGSATASTYTTVGADDGTTLTCKVRASNANGPAAGYTTTSNSCAVSSAASYLLDTMTNAVRAYSTRKLRAAYAGSAIRVRRSSDNAEQDIGFSGENLDTSALTTFVGAGNGFVVTMYDQSGNSDNATNATAAGQPTIVLSGTVIVKNTKACLYGAADRKLNASSAVVFKEANVVCSYGGGATYTNYMGPLGTTATNQIFPAATGSTVWNPGIPGPRDYYTNNGTSSTASPMSDTLYQARSTYTNASTSSIFQLFSQLDAYPWLGYVCEALIWTEQLAGGDITALYNNQKAYWGTP